MPAPPPLILSYITVEDKSTMNVVTIGVVYFSIPFSDPGVLHEHEEKYYKCKCIWLFCFCFVFDLYVYHTNLCNDSYSAGLLGGHLVLQKR